MKKGIIKDVSDRDLSKPGRKHVIIERDTDHSAFSPLVDQDNLFYLHSRITREFCASESEDGYPGLPITEVEDENGCGTGEYKVEDDAFMFPVAAYIHGGIALSLGSGDHFPDKQFDVTKKAAWMWTNKKQFVRLCGEDSWMKVYDKEKDAWRPATKEEFTARLWNEAKAQLAEWQLWNDGYVFGYRTEISYVPYMRLYDDGHTEEEVDWKDGDESCWGFITDKADDIDFPRGEGWEVFDDTGLFVGDEYGIPEFVVTQVNPDGDRFYLADYSKEKGEKVASHAIWVKTKKDAKIFPSWWLVQSAAQDVIDKDRYSAYENCVEIDKIKDPE